MGCDRTRSQRRHITLLFNASRALYWMNRCNLDALIATTGDVGQDLWARCPLLGPGQAVLSSPQLGRSVIVSMRPAMCRRKFVR